MRNEKGFTLIEMLIVLLIISVLILVTIPNVTKHFQTIDAKGCDAYISMIQSQVEAYKIDHHEYPTIGDLQRENYIPPGGVQCPNGDAVEILSDGKVKQVSRSDEWKEALLM